MLKLKNITKTYETNGFKQDALNDVSICFRKSEFASILGPSGSGKTTLLNIVGGLDKYDSGDLIINGVSTKNYNDRDWDSYRNHRIGFVFQSYNLIVHQTILQNVEIALTLSGVSKKERKKRAIEALEKVGLKEHIHKKPNQLSGGQMQRVAIARALINDPDIILADEPTGALDTETSVQIMELLKEISNDKLIIMVTHNPELAETYSTRIIKVKDGVVFDDNNPYDGEEIKEDKTVTKTKEKKTSMSFITALSLSMKNLVTKKGRTALTSFAGSIGIIGIALILAISTGVNNYIDAVQRDTLSSFPIQIEKESADMTTIMENMLGGSSTDSENTSNSEELANRDAVYGNPVMYKMLKSILSMEVNRNNLKDLKVYFDANKEELSQYSNAIQYGYKIDLNVYSVDPNGEYAKADFAEMMNGAMEGGQIMSGISNLMKQSGGVEIWSELLTDPKTGEISSLVTDNYDLLYGKWPTEKNEILLVLNENNEISDVTLHSLGLVDQETMVKATLAAMMGKEDDGWQKYEGKSWSYEEICKIPMKMVLPTDYYKYDETLKQWINISDNKGLLDAVIGKGMTLNVVGIVKPNPDSVGTGFLSSLCYTNELTKYYIDAVNNSEIVKAQTENKENNIITGLPFVIEENNELSDAEKIVAFKEYVSTLTDNEKATLYENILSLPSEKVLKDAVDSILKPYEDKTTDEIIADIKKQYANELGYSEELIDNMLSDYEKEDLMKLLEETIREMVITQYKENAKDTIDKIYLVPSDKELSEMKQMIFSEMYKEINNLQEPQKTIAKQQVNIGFVAQTWVTQTGMDMQSAMSILSVMPAEEFEKTFNKVVNEKATELYAQYGGTTSSSDKNSKVAKALDEYLKKATDEDTVYFYDNHMPDKASDKTYDEVLSTLGVKNSEDPDFIYIYPTSFEMKEKIADMITKYNNGVAEEDKIEYTDIAAMLMSSVSDIITAISVVLICFVSISLIVSSIMIGIITYISVLERTKEIGILRAVGASKKDIARVFNAETAIVGFLAGLVGIVLTVTLCIPISIIAREITSIQTLTAVLPWYGYLLILLSIGLTLIAGLFPAMMAAKKDPVESLRSE